jgi:hypothetical protein
LLQQLDRSHLQGVALNISTDIHSQMIGLFRRLQRLGNLRIAVRVELQKRPVRRNNSETALLALQCARTSMRIGICGGLLRAHHVDYRNIIEALRFCQCRQRQQAQSQQ